ncbi:MAG: hypothetical protein WDN04_13105 [Rhodospirillales bacterium]
MLAAFGRRWADTAHVLGLPDGWLEDPRVREVQDTLVALLGPQISRTKLFGFKDPRTARLMPMWQRVFSALGATPRYVFCVRDPAQVARSLSARDGIVQGQGEYRWLIYNADAVAGVAGAPVCVVPYEDWFSCPLETARRLASFPRVAGARRGAGAPSSRSRPAARRDSSSAGARTGAPASPPHPGRSFIRRFDTGLPVYCACLAEFLQFVQPLLVEREVLQASVAAQNRVIGDLNALVSRLRAERGGRRLRQEGHGLCP